ncbi:hypothetical protein TD95_003127 [Thielaviopsis punctulata]|uniref:Ubiquitin-like domain-containing protein n=1 Tax=Thielaviopsis punctulata TaxID=72032 RepID=A0A0F4Z6Y6_9PEZI|nr:hypothetical protein TD95_003127 [Thielaviopsis punctulata]
MSADAPSESTTAILPVAHMSAPSSPSPPTAAEKGKARADSPSDPDATATADDADDKASVVSGSAAAAAASATAAGGPACLITLLLSSGARHPYKLDDKYLARRNVDAEMLPSGKRDPFSISVYSLKELILREWRDEWDAKPASPSSIRLIYFGKLLDDKDALRQYNFSAENRNVVHMSVRPADIADDDEPKPGSKTNPRPVTPPESTRCCVIL